MRHALIMAGGAGTRLWPLSRKNRPKQLLPLVQGRSLLALSRQRLQNLFPPDRVWIITSAAYLDLVAAELPDVPRQNLIGEPVGRDTANAIGLASEIIARRDADATIAVFTADHVIEPQEEFDESIELGLAAAEQYSDSLVTFGILPQSPHTGYGYVQRGDPVGEGVFEVQAFREKPDETTAREYVEAGTYYWNSGMFAWRAASILAELRRCLPENAPTLGKIASSWPTCAKTSDFAEKFGGLRPISIDYAVMEQARHVLVVEMDCRWTDLGSWASAAEIHKLDKNGNATLAPNTVIANGANNILVSEDDHLLAILGADDLIVVHGADATLICRRGHEQKIKEFAEERRRRFGEKYE